MGQILMWRTGHSARDKDFKKSCGPPAVTVECWVLGVRAKTKEHSSLPCVPGERKLYYVNEGGRQSQCGGQWNNAEPTCVLEEDHSRNLVLSTQLLFGSLFSMGPFPMGTA